MAINCICSGEWAEYWRLQQMPSLGLRGLVQRPQLSLQSLSERFMLTVEEAEESLHRMTLLLGRIEQATRQVQSYP